MAGEGRTQAQCREALPEIVLAADPPRPVGELSSLRSLIDGAVLNLMRPHSGWPVRKLPSIHRGLLEGLVPQAPLNWPGVSSHGAFVAN
jgi:hypothetical protein